MKLLNRVLPVFICILLVSAFLPITAAAEEIVMDQGTLNNGVEWILTIDMAEEPWSLAIEDITDIEQEKTRLVHPFDLDGGRLFHINLMRDSEHYYLYIDTHSTSILIILSLTAPRC